MEDNIKKKFAISYDATIFKPIPGHREYVINNDGSIIKRVESEKEIRRPFITQSWQMNKHKERTGYLYAMLLTSDAIDINGNIYDSVIKIKNVGVHRLVALTWCENNDPSTKVWVNHEDGVKHNNYYLNLKWETISYNIQHSVDTGLRTVLSGKDHWRTGVKVSKEVKQQMSEAKRGKKHPKYTGAYITPKGIFHSSYAAGNANGINHKRIIRICKSEAEDGFSFKPVTPSPSVV